MRISDWSSDVCSSDLVATVGNPAGKPIIEFFDYNCGFCKRFHSETATPLLAAGDVKMILVHTPILVPGSERLAEFAAAANLQGKFEGAHHFLSQHNARDVAEADKLIPELVTAAGLDRAKFDRSLNDGAAKRQVEHNTRLSMTAGVARSEEHTSELQSLMRNQDAVLCFENKQPRSLDNAHSLTTR